MRVPFTPRFNVFELMRYQFIEGSFSKIVEYRSILIAV